MIITNKTNESITITSDKTGISVEIFPGKKSYGPLLKDDGLARKLLSLRSTGKLSFALPVIKDKKR